MNNRTLEGLNYFGKSSHIRKRYRDIIKDLGSRKITLENIAEETKSKGFLDVLDKNNATLDDAVIIQQYAKAVLSQDTKAAEFLRDTAGEKPSTQVNVSDINKGLSDMSSEEIKNHIDTLTELAMKLDLESIDDNNEEKEEE